MIIIHYNQLGHRGDLTEELLNNTHDYFKRHNLAFIKKIPVPVKVIQRIKNTITQAFFESKGMLDYVGVCQGLPISFDSKETNKPSLPLSNIAEHQFDFIEDFNKQDGYAFIICNFKKSGKFYLIPGEFLLKSYKASLKGGKKSISEKDMETKYEIPLDERRYVLNYLPQLNLYYKDRCASKTSTDVLNAAGNQS